MQKYETVLKLNFIEIKYLFVLNLMDMVLTFFSLQANFITEANPLMAALYAIHPMTFIITKGIMVPVLLKLIDLSLQKCNRRDILQRLLYIPLAAYAMVVFLNIAYIIISADSMA